MRLLVLLAVLQYFALGLCLPFFIQNSPDQRPIHNDLDPYPALGKPRIVFKPDGTFKITVFSDLHFGENPWDDWGPQQDRNSIKLMNTILPDEKPDFVALNGDLITGENTFRENSTTLIDQIVGPLNAAGVPFASTHGNHDNQPNITHREEILREQELAPLSYTRLAPEGVGGVQGEGNYWVPVYESESDDSPILILWFFDSRGGFSPNPSPTALPDWVDQSVADWIASETAKMEAVWGPADTRQAVAFMHIPPYAILNMQSSVDPDNNPGLNADQLGKGSVQSSGDPSNAGKDQPFWNALTSITNLRVVISGHVHGNEWCVRESVKDVIFCFNKHSGYGGYDREGWGHGVRNLVFRTPSPETPIDTWIRLETGGTRAHIVLNDSYDN